jgi:CRP/FNR family transcriptional regulator, cyclic AMP receptor protein
MAQSLPDAMARGMKGPRSRTQPEQGPRLTRRRSAVALSGIPIFQSFSRRHLNSLATQADEVRFQPGEHVVEEGMLGETLYVILEGEAKVVRGGRKVATLLPGDFFGELSALDGGPRSATVTAQTPLSAVRLFRRTLMGLAEREPGLTIGLLQGIAHRIREIQRPLEA